MAVEQGSTFAKRYWLVIVAISSSCITLWALTENNIDRRRIKRYPGQIYEFHNMIYAMDLEPKKKTMEKISLSNEKLDEKINPKMPEIIDPNDAIGENPRDVAEKLKKSIVEHQTFSQEVYQQKLFFEKQLLAERTLRTDAENNLDLVSEEFTKFKREHDNQLINEKKKNKALEEQLRAIELTRNKTSDSRETMWLQMLKQKQDELEAVNNAKLHSEEQHKFTLSQLQEAKLMINNERMTSSKANEFSNATIQSLEQDIIKLRAHIRELTDNTKAAMNGHGDNNNSNNHIANDSNHYTINFAASALWGETQKSS